MTDAASQQKRRLGTIAWIGIGCVSFLLMALVIGGGLAWWTFTKAKSLAKDFETNPVAAARWVINKIPDVEEVSVDEENGTVTVRNVKTGEVITVDFEELRNGRLRFHTQDGDFAVAAPEGEDGTVSITSDKGKLSFAAGKPSVAVFPDWAPMYSPLTIEGQHSLHHDTGTSGGYHGLTTDSLATVTAFFDDSLSRAGFAVTKTEFSGNATHSVMLNATAEATHRTVVVSLTEKEGGTGLALTFNEGK